MNIWENIKRAFATPEVRKRILFTIFLLVIYRFLANIPSPDVNVQALQNLFSQNKALGAIDIFSGSTLSNFAIIAVGVSAYINSLLVIQLLTPIIPKLEELQNEGENGRRTLIQLIRVATVPIAILQSVVIILGFKSAGFIYATDILSLVTIVASMTAGSMLLMWIGENITESGIGQGISLIIACNILQSVPHKLIQMFQSESVDPISLFLVAGVYLGLIVFVIFINEAIRKIPLSFARRVSVMGPEGSFLPIRVNSAGVIPAFFAIYLILGPQYLAQFLESSKYKPVSDAAYVVANFLQNQTYSTILNFILIFALSFFYVTLNFNPKKVAEDQQKRGGFIPGIRPGKKTEEYISTILKRVTFIGGLALAIIVTIPNILQNISGITLFAILGGSSIIIVVGVILPIMSQVKAYMVTRSYDKFSN